MEKDVTRQIEEQLSAFIDGELPEEELAMLVRRLERDESHRATLDRYAMIGGLMRNDPVASNTRHLRRRISASLQSDSAGHGSNTDLGEASTTSESAIAEGGGQMRYLLAASMVVGVMAVFFAGGFNRDAGSLQTQTLAQSAVSEGTTQPTANGPVIAVADQEEASQKRSRHQRELLRIKLTQERMRSYLISHGDYSRPMQGALADSSMYVQQASFSE